MCISSISIVTDSLHGLYVSPSNTLLKPGNQVQRFVEQMLGTGKGLVAFLQCAVDRNVQVPLNLFLKHCWLNTKIA